MDDAQDDTDQAWIAPGDQIISLPGVTQSFGSHQFLAGRPEGPIGMDDRHG